MHDVALPFRIPGMKCLMPGCIWPVALMALSASAAEAPPAKPLRPDEQVRARIVERKLEDWRVKKVAFDEATVDEALAFFKAEAKKVDPEGKGLNFVLSPGAQATAAEGRITLTLDEVPLGIALRYSLEMIGLEYRVEPFVVMIDKRRAAGAPTP